MDHNRRIIYKLVIFPLHIKKKIISSLYIMFFNWSLVKIKWAAWAHTGVSHHGQSTLIPPVQIQENIRKVVQYQKSIANEFPYLCLNAPSHIAKKKIDHILVQNVHIIEKKATIDNIITQIANIYGFKIHQGYLGK